MKIAEFLEPSAVIADLKGTTKPEIFQELSARLAEGRPRLSASLLAAALSDREKLGSTGIGEGVAIPHGKVVGLDRLIAAFGVSRQGVNFEAIDGKPTQLFFALFAPENSAGIHLKALARISRLLKNRAFRESLICAATAEEIHRLISNEDLKG